MSAIVSTFRRDANNVPIWTTGIQNSKAITFDGGTGTGATGTVTLFSVTGVVEVNVFGFCTADLVSAGGGTLKVGTATSTATLCSQQNATAITNHEVWHNSSLAVGANVAAHLHPVNENVILTIATGAVTAGTLTFYVNWVPVSSDGNLTVA